MMATPRHRCRCRCSATEFLLRKHKLVAVDVYSKASCGSSYARLRGYQLQYASPDADTQQNHWQVRCPTVCSVEIHVKPVRARCHWGFPRTALCGHSRQFGLRTDTDR